MPRKAVPPNVCAICDSELIKSFRPVAPSSDPSAAKPDAEEVVHKLNCGHQFHEFCLRGWTVSSS